MSKILIIGSGSREDALVWKLSQSQKVSHVFVCPGNAGSNLACHKKVTKLDLDVKDNKQICEWCKKESIDLVVVGPEDPLVNGLVDDLYVEGILCFGPSKRASQIESSKAFSKALMTKYNIPTANWQQFTNSEEACLYIKNADFPALVVKASGLALGKGVIVANSKEEACQAAIDMLDGKIFGEAGSIIVVEELLEGEEISCLVFCDGEKFCMMPLCQDHKRLLTGDLGPNTGGMGAYCPVKHVSRELLKMIEEQVVVRTLDAMKEEGHPFKGVLYPGLILTESGPKVLEFNCRFGDPETQVLLPLLKSDLYEILRSCALGTLTPEMVIFESNKSSLGIVLASAGYPDNVVKGVPISNYENKNPKVESDNVFIFFAGSKFTVELCNSKPTEMVTNGGRVATVVALADSIMEASQCALKAVEKYVLFEGRQFRGDIGWRAIEKEKKMATGLTYKDSGVDISVGDAFVNIIKPLAMATKRIGCVDDLGSFGAIFDPRCLGYKDPVLVSGTDGVGTKLKIANILRKHDTIGIDLVAMCVNDILCHGAEPLFFLDYFASGKLDLNVASDVVKGIAVGCKIAGCALIGGETAEMPGMYQTSEYDLAGFSVGIVEREKLLPIKNTVDIDDKSINTRTCIESGDLIIGIASSGIHSNGYSLVRKVLESTFGSEEYVVKGLAELAPFDSSRTLGDYLLQSTEIYVKSVLPLMRLNSCSIKAAAHITGGGISGNLERVLPEGLGAEFDALKWDLHPLFVWISHHGNISEKEMLKTFNCGLGMLLVVSPSDKNRVMDGLMAKDKQCWVVGSVVTNESENDKVRVLNLSSAINKTMTTKFPKNYTNQNKPEKSVNSKKRVAVLISGSGTNLQSLIDYSKDTNCPYEISLVLSNCATAYGLTRAKEAEIDTEVIENKNFKTRVLFDKQIHLILLKYHIDIVCLAGFMRILTEDFVTKWSGKMLNIHPSLLPSFKGMHAHKLTLEAGVTISGCTVHFVSNELDAGAILVQDCVPVYHTDTIDTLSQRILKIEHKAYPKALKMLSSDQVSLNSDGKLVWKQ